MTSIEEKFEESKRLGLQIAKESAEEDRLMTLSVGPQHPGSGHFRFVIKVDGDYIVFAMADGFVGVVHRECRDQVGRSVSERVDLVAVIRFRLVREEMQQPGKLTMAAGSEALFRIPQRRKVNAS